ncbi:cupin domain-containing protein [Aquitalea magnusonii]|uniref:50S ribosomal protein L16 3-hydroxylase n=1 Tax=Aquitalea magnusonii TaxID=332411 RepID=A0A318JA73_9NEIS|nr:cupin domain-containing protein [Aquitalea magnusonii]PXX43467.1 50S ribosomal protein L16 3-hydroxylase [Aquitalea magnusonii]
MKPMTLLGGLTPEQFLNEYWQKKPLLIRGALTDVGPHVDFKCLSELAMQDDVESRLIENRNGKWHLERGPFRPARFRKLGETDWTILVQNVNHHLPHIDKILWQFDFIPFARLDDLMISYAPPGGTVGPHFDSYDVFLLQVGGRKRWQISSQADDDFIPDAPIRVLQDFRVEEEFVLEHGDMLYLPPKCAHYGVALEPGMTYSIGFRAAPTQELATQFLVYLQDRICLEGRYADPELQRQSDPARISDEMVDKVSQMLSQISWDKQVVSDFLGHYLTEPKAHVFYDAPEDELDEDEFAAALGEKGIELDRKSLILFHHGMFYCNGELLEIEPDDVAVWQQFANQRRLSAADIRPSLLDQLYQGYLTGYWHFPQSVAK